MDMEIINGHAVDCTIRPHPRPGLPARYQAVIVLNGIACRTLALTEDDAKASADAFIARHTAKPGPHS